MPEALLELATPRRIRLYDRGRAFTLTCRRVEAADWRAYFSAFAIISEQQGNQRITTMDFDTPRTVLAERVIESVEGYKFAEGVDPKGDGWQGRLPLAHRRQVGATLADVRVSTAQLDEEFVIRAEGEEVLLDCTWSLDESTGKMVGFQGLKHIFRTPTAAQHKRYNQAASRSVVIGGSRNGRTVYSGPQELLCDLYDELIVSVEGYSVDGTVLTGRAPISAWMDLCHKFIAAQELFAPSSTVSTEAAAAE